MPDAPPESQPLTGFTVAEVKRAWAQTHVGLGQEEDDQRVLGFAALVRGIAREGAVSPEAFGAALGVGAARAREVFEGLGTVGVQIDPSGNVVGAALTTQPTPHRIRMAGQAAGTELYAWCALDTLFIPGLLEEAAEVESTCPMSGAAVRLTVTPRGVKAVTPTDAVVSVVVPGNGGAPIQTGPASPT